MRAIVLLAPLVFAITAACDSRRGEPNTEHSPARERPAAASAPTATIVGEAADGEHGANEPSADAAESVEDDATDAGSQLADLEPGESRHFGEPFVSDGEPLTLSEAIAQCNGTGEICKVRAKVATSCQSKGCWFTVREAGVEPLVRVEMKDYGFFVPLNAHETDATFEGTLTQRTISAATARHFAREAGGDVDPEKIRSPQKSLTWTITGVTLERAAEL